jgi:hypothetical protein
MREHGRASLGRIVTDRENPLTILGHAPDELTRAHRAQQLAMSLDEAGLLALTRALMTPDADLRASILAVLTVRKYATAKGVARALRRRSARARPRTCAAPLGRRRQRSGREHLHAIDDRV